MASIGHIAVGMAAARLRGRGASFRALLGPMVAWSVLSMAPDLDVLGFRVGIPYEHPLGHRGASHALFTAVVVGALIGVLLWRQGAAFFPAAVMATAVTASHGLLDALTDGGLGAALLWPFTDQRFFFVWQPIPVAPIGRAYFSERGVLVGATELLMFGPLVAYAMWPRRRAS